MNSLNTHPQNITSKKLQTLLKRYNRFVRAYCQAFELEENAKVLFESKIGLTIVSKLSKRFRLPIPELNYEKIHAVLSINSQEQLQQVLTESNVALDLSVLFLELREVIYTTLDELLTESAIELTPQQLATFQSNLKAIQTQPQ